MIDRLLCYPIDAPVEIDVAGLDTAIVPYTQGLPMTMRTELLGYNSGLLCIVIAMMLLVIFNIRQYSRYFTMLYHNMWSLRRRSTMFDEHTVNEARIMLVLVIQVCVCEAIIMLGYIYMKSVSIPPDKVVVIAIGLIIATLAYYLVQLLAYKVIGYVFADKEMTEQLVNGFNSSQTLLGFLLLFPAMLLLFYPAVTEIMAVIGVIFYVLARFIFIYKGFRIFYSDFSSLLYFILYLCTVEVIPVILLIRGIFSLCCNYIN
jgi:hypothetical protein